jgi:hypothetical protein
MINSEWIRCPICGGKTRNKIREYTVLVNYPLFCPKCKQESLIVAESLHITIIQQPISKLQK